MIKILITVIAIVTAVYLIMELLIQFFEIPILVFKIRQIVAYINSICFTIVAAMTYKYGVLMWFFVVFAVYWLVRSLIDRAEFYIYLETAEKVLEEQNEQEEG